MLRNNSIRLVLAFGLVISILLAAYSANTVVGQEDLFSDIRGKVAGISEKEKETLQKLFTQAQTIKETQTKVVKVTDDIKKAQIQIDYYKKLIEKDEAACQKERENLKLVLQCYQRMGPGSYLEIILESDSLPDLLMRINVLRDLTHNTGDLMERITKDKEKQTQEKAKLSAEFKVVQIKQQRLVKILAEEKRQKADLEKYLASLASQKGYYQGHLNNLEQAWSEVKPFFESTAKKLTAFSEKMKLPSDAFKITLHSNSADVSITDATINKLLAGDPELSRMKFAFRSGKVLVQFPDRNLTLAGSFLIMDNHSLEFIPEEGSFFGILLNQNIVMELLENVNLTLDLETVLDGNALKSVDITDGTLTITV